MKRIILMGALGLSGILMAFTPVKERIETGSRVPTATWTLDKAHTNVKFSVSHLVISDVEGQFKSFDGTMESSKPDFSDAKVTFTIEVASINTDNEKRDNHLKSDDFLNAEKYPQMKFVSTSVTPEGDNKFKLAGDLTIRNITKPVVFDVKYGGTVTAMGGTHAGFKATTKINRFDYDLKWSMATESGGLVAGKDVDITINVDFKKS